MDEQLILTGSTLRLNPALQRSVPSKGISVLRARGPRPAYLTLSDEQWEVLRNFLNPIAVPDVLRVLILRRTCIPIREFYELVLKAHRAGVLVTETSSVAESDQRWSWWRLPGSVFVLPCWTAIAVAMLGIGLNGLPLPADWKASIPFLAAGWVATLIAMTLGDFAAACVITRAAGVVGRPFLKWKTLTPHIGVALGEARMLKRWEQVGVWSARLMPLAILVVCLVVYWPHFALIPIAALLVALRPFGTGSLMPIVSALCRGEVLDTQKDLLFRQNRRWHIRLKFGLQRVTFLYLFVRLVLGAAWSFFLVSLALRAVGSSLKEVYGDVGYWTEVGRWLTLGFGIALVLYLIPPVFRRSRYLLFRRARSILATAGHWLADVKLTGSHASILQTMAMSQIFRRLSQANRLALVVEGELNRLAPWRTWSSADGILPVGLILSGRIAVYRKLGKSRTQRVATYEEGDVIGSEPWTDPDGGVVILRSLSPVILLEWPAEVFGQKVITELGVSIATDLMVKVPFLRHLPLCHRWHPQALVRFAQIARFCTFEANHKILVEGDAVLWFFIIFTGRVSSRRRRGGRSYLSCGDYFGEISLMRQDVATADVITEGVSRCLLIHRPEFLRFMAHNPIVALEVERVSSRRFGQPVFPYRKPKAA